MSGSQARRDLRPKAFFDTSAWSKRPTQSQRGTECAHFLQCKAAGDVYGHFTEPGGGTRTDWRGTAGATAPAAKERLVSNSAAVRGCTLTCGHPNPKSTYSPLHLLRKTSWNFILAALRRKHRSYNRAEMLNTDRPTQGYIQRLDTLYRRSSQCVRASRYTMLRVLNVPVTGSRATAKRKCDGSPTREAAT